MRLKNICEQAKTACSWLKTIIHKGTVYLVDTENVGDWFARIGNPGRYDKIILFYTGNPCGSVQTQQIPDFLGFAAQVQTVECSYGHPNALDFQLSTWLGSKASIFPKIKYAIISKDRGYDAVCSFWKEKGVHVSRLESQESKILSVTKLPIDYADYNRTNFHGLELLPVPAKVEPQITALLKTKYRNDTNLRAAYAAIRSGDEKTIRRTVKEIEKDCADTSNVEDHWVRMAPHILAK